MGRKESVADSLSGHTDDTLVPPMIYM